MTISKEIEAAIVEVIEDMGKPHGCEHLGADVIFNFEHYCYEMICPNCGTVGFISAVAWARYNGESN